MKKDILAKTVRIADKSRTRPKKVVVAKPESGPQKVVAESMTREMKMKKLTCRDLGGACDASIVGATFEEIGQKCHAHVMEALKRGDTAHKAAVDRMKSASPSEQAAMMAEYKKKFDAAPDA